MRPSSPTAARVGHPRRATTPRNHAVLAESTASIPEITVVSGACPDRSATVNRSRAAWSRDTRCRNSDVSVASSDEDGAFVYRDEHAANNPSASKSEMRRNVAPYENRNQPIHLTTIMPSRYPASRVQSQRSLYRLCGDRNAPSPTSWPTNRPLCALARTAPAIHQPRAP